MTKPRYVDLVLLFYQEISSPLNKASYRVKLAKKSQNIVTSVCVYAGPGNRERKYSDGIPVFKKMKERYEKNL